MASNSASPLVYDPRSATDITPFLQQSDTSASAQREAKERIQKLFRIEQTGELVASTSTRNLLIWRFNPHGAAAILRAHTDWAEVLAHCYKRKPPQDGKDEEDSMVLFSGGADSVRCSPCPAPSARVRVGASSSQPRTSHANVPPPARS